MMLTLIFPIEEVFVRFLHYKVILFSLSLDTELFGRKSLCSGHTWGGGSHSPPPWRESMYINYWEFVCIWELSFFHSFIYSVIYLYKYLFMDIYALGYNPILCYSFSCSNCPSIVHWELFQLAHMPTWHSSNGVFGCFILFLSTPFQHYKTFQANVIY